MGQLNVNLKSLPSRAVILIVPSLQEMIDVSLLTSSVTPAFKSTGIRLFLEKNTSDPKGSTKPQTDF